jgi:branched-chain amino acid transport system substrate-binding protein
VKRTISIYLALLLVVAMVAAGCTGKTTTTSGGGATSGGATTSANPIVIGAVVSVTGPAAPLGEGEKATLEMLAEDLNAKGGINGRPVKLILEDDASDPAKAVAATSKLISQDKVVAIIGGTTSPSSIAMKAETIKAGIPQISMAAGIPITNPFAPTVFRTAQSDALAVAKVIGYLESQKVKNIAILHDSNSFGQSGSDQLTKLAKPAGLTIVANESYETAATDVTPQLTKIKGKNPQIVVVWGTNPGPAIAARNMRELGMKQPFVGSHGIANMTFIDLAGKGKTPQTNPANGVVFPAGHILIPSSLATGTPQRSVIDGFVSEFTAKYGKAPNSFAGHAWDAFQILVDALGKVKSDDPALITTAIQDTKGFVGISGIFTYTSSNHDGLAVSDLILIKIQDGKWTLLK